MINKTKTLTDWQVTQINQLWNEEFPLKLNNRFGLLLEGVKNYNHYLMEDENKNIAAWAVDFEKDHEIRFSVIVADKHKGKGFGSELLKQLKATNETFYGWVIDHHNDQKMNGEKYQSPLPFYIKHGFEVLQDARIDNEMLNAVKIKWSKKQ